MTNRPTPSPATGKSPSSPLRAPSKVDPSKLIVALDYPQLAPAQALVDALGDRVEWFKVGPALLTHSGGEVVRYLKAKRRKVFVDFKTHDTPRVVAETIRQFADLGADMASVHCLGGRAMLEAAAVGCRGTKLQLLGVTLLTTQAADDLKFLGWPASATEMVETLTKLAVEARLAGVVCSAHEIEAVRQLAPSDFIVVAAGIRLPGQEVFQDDQRRVASPEEALRKGADFLLMGRPFTQARDPKSVLAKM